jgi:low temperature requirement protein LtrA
MEDRLEYDIAWSINPFVHNPYQKRHHDSGPSTPHFGGSPGPTMITVQQMRPGRTMSKDPNRRTSVEAHALSIFDNLGTPKASYAELFYDLFFVASLTSFGIKHEITQDQAIASYVAFFTVLWWVWTSQSFYDVRFETGDVIHRLFKFAQLLLLAGFAAFAGRFDVYYGFPNDYGLENDGNPFTSDRTSGFFAFKGMTLVYIISRGILALQYVLLYFYARRKNYPAANQFLLQIAALIISGAMWLGSYFLEGEGASDAMKIAKFGLWYGGIAIEFAASIVAWMCCRVTGFRRTHLTERLATLTLLILGEGVIGYAIALQGSIFLQMIKLTRVIGGIGFGAPAGCAVVMVCLIIYLLWLLYFSTFDGDAQYSVPKAYSWVDLSCYQLILDLHALSVPRCSYPHSHSVQFAHDLCKRTECRQYVRSRK